MIVIPIDRDNVILKFTSGIDLDDVSQHTRIHNIKIWGVPGGPETGIEDTQTASVRTYYAKGTGLVVKGEVLSLRIYDLQGRLVLESDHGGNQVIDLSDHPDGSYFLTSQNRDQETYNLKFVKH